MPMARALLAAGLLVVALAACSGAKKPPMDPLEWHRAALEATAPARVGAPAPGSPEERRAVEAFVALFSDFSADNIRRRTRAVYARDVWFNDTLKSVRGVEELERYLLHGAANVESCTVDVDDVASRAGEHYVRWRMHIRFKKLQTGRVHDSIGLTHLRFDREGKVVYHQDYWDAAGGFFEKLPVLGWMIRKVKGRL